MATISKQGILESLNRLGELAASENDHISLVLVGGGLMVLLFGERDTTRDLDVLIEFPAEAQRVRKWAQIVAAERGWPDDWLNDAAKGFIIGVSEGDTVFSAPGIEVRRPSFAQLLAMKLCAWRDELDISDARRLLKELTGTQEEIWQMVVKFLTPGRELKARYAFDDLWEGMHGRG